jgi:hypothetical protein
MSSATWSAQTGPEERHSRAHRFNVSIPRVRTSGEQQDVSASSASARVDVVSADAGPGGEQQHIDPSASSRQRQSTDSDVAPQEPAEGETITIPDIVVPLNFAVTDAVTSKLLFETLTTLEETDPGEGHFGLTTAYAPVVSDITVTASGGTYTVTGVLESEIKMQVRGQTGPNGEIDVAHAFLTEASYPVIVSDLTPNMSDQNGRPPRTRFWSHDLTVKHERFHATEDDHFSEVGATQAIAWLTSQRVSSAAGVKDLLSQLPNRVLSTVAANMAAPASEQRAYGDGAASYKALADSIKATGDAKGYPADPAGIGLIFSI